MKQIKSILINTICIVSLFGLMSCIKEIDLESLRPDPTLVVNCVAITGEPLTVSNDACNNINRRSLGG